MGEINQTLPTVTIDEVAKHNTEDDVWLVIRGKVYDVTNWIHYHPGGWLPLVNMAGKDATDGFWNYHPDYVWEKLPPFHVANLAEKDATPTKFVTKHRELAMKLDKMGLFQTDYSFYAWTLLRIYSLLAAALYITLSYESFAAHMCGAVLLGCYWQQLAFVGHDLGHNGVTHVQKTDSILGSVLGTFSGGISIQWWKRTHNVHHIVCNSIESDPDIQHLPAMACDKRMFDGFYSLYHLKDFVFDGACRFLVAYQHYLFYIIMGFARFNLYAQSWILLLSKEKVTNRALDMAALTGFFIWLGAVVYQLPANHMLPYVLVSHFVSGILHVQIVLSHFAMEMYTGKPYTPGNQEDEWWRLQLRTTQDIDCYPWMDWFHGGLQFQAIHHLFPRIPRHNLRKVRDYVVELCKEEGVHYQCPTFIEANKDLIRHMRAVAIASRNHGPHNFFQSMIWSGLNAEG